MEEELCKECEKKWSCKYLKHRFDTKDKQCGYDYNLVTLIHDMELQSREEMLKVTNNYGRDM